MVHSLNKGKRWELEASKILSVSTKAEWHRVPMSGAFSTNNPRLQANQFKGDVFTENETLKHITIECKATRFLSMNMLFNKKSMLHQWITKLEFTNSEWCLLVKPDNQGAYAFSPNPETLELLFPGVKPLMKLLFVYYVVKIK